MRCIPISHLILSLLVGSSVPAAAGEVTGFVGYRTGDADFHTGIACVAVIGVPCPIFAANDDDFAWGAIVDLPISETWMFEIYAQRYEADLTLEFIGGFALPLDLSPFFADFELFASFPLTIPTTLELETLQAGVMKVWRGGNVEPFLALDGGVTQVRIVDGRRR